MLRQLERWLHQHIFKVGWLLTKNFTTTTILYYTFFLPGIVAYEVVYWLAAGVLNVRAERAIALPEKQDVGELRLTFVKLSKKAPSYKVTLINAAPLVTGILLIWFITTQIIDVGSALQSASDGSFDSVTGAVSLLLATPDFWLWAYIGFTIGNTMMPDVTVLKLWRWFLWPVLGAAVLLFALGVGEEIIGQALDGPVTNALNVLSTAFLFIVVLDLAAVGFLGGIESLVERITGDSATFKGGKMIVLTRAEAIAERQKERERQRQAQKKLAQSAPALPSGTPSIYKLTFPIPGAPGQEPISRQAARILEPEVPPVLPGDPRPQRIEPDVIPAQAKPAPASPPPRPMPVFGGTAALRQTREEADREAPDLDHSSSEDEDPDEIIYEDVDDLTDYDALDDGGYPDVEDDDT